MLVFQPIEVLANEGLGELHFILSDLTKSKKTGVLCIEAVHDNLRNCIVAV